MEPFPHFDHMVLLQYLECGLGEANHKHYSDSARTERLTWLGHVHE